MKVADALGGAAQQLTDAGVAEPRPEAGSLLEFAIGREKVFLIAHPDYDLTSAEMESYDHVVTRRAAREPFQYIVGKQEFYGLDFEVNPDVLIPRPETELLVERAISELAKLERPKFCEIGVGSGCIAVSVLKNVPEATAIGVDISEKALDVAGKNAKKHGVADRLVLRKSDIFSAVGDERFHAVLSNPPYVPDADMLNLQAEVRDFEPALALTDGRDGLWIIERIVSEAPIRLRSGGILMIEIGVGQAERVAQMFDGVVWQAVEFLHDLQQIPRTVIAVKL